MKHWLTGAAALTLMTNVALAESAQRVVAPVGPQEGSTAATMSTKALQESLNQNGANLPVDGTMGPATTAAISEFQYSHGLQTTGKLDRPTQAALDFSAAQIRNDAQYPQPPVQPASVTPSAERDSSTAPRIRTVAPASLGFSNMPDNGSYHEK